MGNTDTTMFLNYCFHHYENSICPVIREASKEFLGMNFEFSLVSASYEPGFIWRDNDYFVTQIDLAEGYPLILKISNTAANLIFLETIGQRQNETGFLKLKDITELEANILSGYTEFLYDKLVKLFLDKKEINSISHTLKNEKTLYFTLYISGNNGQEAGRIIFSFPQFVFRKTLPITGPKQPLNYEFFSNSYVEASILIGKTCASLDDIKNLEPEDVIILENSSLHTMYLRDFENIGINVNPSHSLVLDFEEDGDDDIVSESTKTKVNIWDSLEVDVKASFENVKIKLGELREITEGLVIDVASVANNKVFIEVENRQLAAGELVIIGDKYGVKITEISTEAKTREVEKLEEEAAIIEQEETEIPVEETPDEFDDFDDSDFELDEEEVIDE